jgi:cytochrome c553
MKKLMAVVAMATLAASPVLAAEDGAKVYAEKTCAACHGPAGNKTLMPDYPKIAGQNAKYLEKADAGHQERGACQWQLGGDERRDAAGQR